MEYSNSDLSLPSLSVIIPTYNSAEGIDITIDSLMQQYYPSLEVIVIDGGSEDRTLEFIKSKAFAAVKIYVSPQRNLFDRLNRGSVLAKGTYLNFLFPGDSYLHPHALEQMMHLAALEKGEEYPDLLYSGCLLRSPGREVQIVSEALSVQLAKRGEEPARLQSLWLRRDFFFAIGQFPNSCLKRAGFDLICRILQKTPLTFSRSTHILVDHLDRPRNLRRRFSHFLETAQLIFHYFGFFAALSYVLQIDRLKRSLFRKR
ncbi:MAG: hypothetical protein K0S07_961 [Chlamydiales bacterium]|jgi:hypothetical protein|nr:hypothetical protein [Chlamydiales bacterium]